MIRRFAEALSDVKRKPKRFGSEHLYKDYLEQKFQTLHPTPSWASKPTKADQSPDDDHLERVAGDFLEKRFDLDHTSFNYKPCGSLNKVDEMKVRSAFPSDD